MPSQQKEVAIFTADEKLAKFLLSNPYKNTTLQFIWMATAANNKCVWMLVDGAKDSGARQEQGKIPKPTRHAI